MAKKTTKKTAAPAGESFLADAENGAATATVQAAAEPAATKAKRVYKARSGKAVRPSAIQAAYDLGCKHTAARMELGA